MLRPMNTNRTTTSPRSTPGFVRSTIMLTIAAGTVSAVTPAVLADGPTVLPQRSAEAAPRRTSLVQRAPIDTSGRTTPSTRGDDNVSYPTDVRTIDGLGNNIANPQWGASGITLRRAVPNSYDDGIGNVPAGSGRPSARAVSNAMCVQVGSIPNGSNASDYLWQWGQFLDHDIDETPIGSPAVHFDINVPMGDPFFDPNSTGTQTIGMDRSAGLLDSGVIQQLNNITSFIDASNVYGSEEERTHALRSNDGTGKMKMSEGDLLMYNTAGLPNAPTSADPSMFLAGDVRANEQAALTAMHTLFVREHNRLCDEIAAEFPGSTGDEIFERARGIVAAQMQAITYNEFLPLLLGDGAIPTYTGYNASVNPSITNVFATAAYRFGHTMLSPQIMRLDSSNQTIAAGNLPLRDAFFTPSIVEIHGIDSMLRGLSRQHAQRIDTHIISDVRNFLFGQPGSGGFDLASLNMQRGRDHGLGTFNDVRMAFGMTPAATFEDICPDPNVFVPMSGVYNSPDDVDAWIGMLAEPHAPGAMVGETLARVLTQQFTDLRDGDRFWYACYLPTELVDEVNGTKLSDIIRRNTDIGTELADDVFRVIPDLCAADFNNDSAVNVFDIIGFIQAHAGNQPGTDLNEDGQFNILDVIAFITQWNAGCP